MKFSKKLEEISKKPSSVKSDILKKKSENLKVSKLGIKDKKNFEAAKSLLQKINGTEYDAESSFSGENLRELSLADIMRAINELSAEPDNSTKSITECSSRMAQDFDIFWTSPRAILRAIKYAILRRDWDNITHLLLLLLHHKGQYVQIVHKLCIFIARFNPMILKFGLRDEFEILKEKRK
ncbi:uncharacterized protein LOC123306628 [Coccinella septempunctata]|uniref:uncharacterized protein LOC123306628 n=1 Tax=Coccinella septempunctata TaxID=41139 RepID=UPI001D096E9F|nr:uncharacterized protein LOC123306628 [Coccinella septempunctata]